MRSRCNRGGKMLHMAMVLTSMTFGPAVVAAPRKPAALAIYYGYPGLINGASSNIAAAATVFAEYDVVVLGDGLQFGEHTDHANTRRIIRQLRNAARPPEVFGYIPLGPSTNLDAAAIERRARLWASMGATGIFYDEAGRDFGVSFARVVSAVQAARRHGLTVCLNAFDLSAIEDGMRQPEYAHLVSKRDALLLESFGVRLGLRRSGTDTAAQMRPADALRRQTGIRVFGITTTAADRPFHASDFAFARDLAAAFRLDAFGWGGLDYGARDSRLAPRPR